MARHLDHIDLRVTSLVGTRSFYEALLPSGPDFEAAFYYAVFFEDPCGHRLEICHRTANGSEAGPDDAYSRE